MCHDVTCGLVAGHGLPAGLSSPTDVKRLVRIFQITHLCTPYSSIMVILISEQNLIPTITGDKTGDLIFFVARGQKTEWRVTPLPKRGNWSDG